MNTGARFISAKNIIWEIYRDTKIQDEISPSDVFEWVTDCLLLIGAPLQFKNFVTGHKDNPNLDIQHFRAKLPCGFIKVRQVAVNGFPTFPATNNFQQLMDGNYCGTNELGTTMTDGTFVDNFGNTFQTNLGTKYNQTPLTYELNDDYITLSVKEGKVCMSYYGFAVDCDGIPMIPDEISYKEAIKKFVLNKLDYINWRNNPDSSGLKALYDDSTTEYCWYVGQAASKSKMPDLDTMEIIKNSLLKLAPNTNQWNNFMANLSFPELRKLQ